jgi:hypothetical protein
MMETQRLEADELRRKQEIERRKTQQRAKKEQKIAVHKKFTCRNTAKGYLAHLKRNS